MGLANNFHNNDVVSVKCFFTSALYIFLIVILFIQVGNEDDGSRSPSDDGDSCDGILVSSTTFDSDADEDSNEMNVDSFTTNTSDLSPVRHPSHGSPSVSPPAEKLHVEDVAPTTSTTCEVTTPLPVSTRHSLFGPIADDAAHDDDDDAETAFGESCTCATCATRSDNSAYSRMILNLPRFVGGCSDPIVIRCPYTQKNNNIMSSRDKPFRLVR